MYLRSHTSLFVTYLGAKFSNNLSWTSHVSEVFFKVWRLSFYALKLRKLSVNFDIIFKFVSSCILPLWLYCSPNICPGLLSKDFILFSRSLKHLAKCSGIAHSKLLDFVVSQHDKACYVLSTRILSDEGHLLHSSLSKCVSTSSTRFKFKLLYARNATFRNSVIPYLGRFLVERDKCLNELRSHLLR